jgi:flagellin
LGQAVRNANDGISLINVTEGALNEQSGILIRLRELSSQSAPGTIGSPQRQTIQLEFDALRSEIDRIAGTTAFNGQKLIDGSLASSVAAASHILIQIGIDNSANSRIDLNTQVNLTSITSSSLLTSAAATSVTVGTRLADLSITTAAGALTALQSINDFISQVTAGRGKVGAVQNRLTHSIANLQIAVENLTSADSSIRDADIAKEVALLTRNQILVQSATAMVGQANLLPQSVLQLLR